MNSLLLIGLTWTLAPLLSCMAHLLWLGAL